MSKKITSFILVLILTLVAIPFAYAADVIAVTINGTPVVFDTPPQIVESRTLVPVRKIFEALGGQVDWDANTKTATAVLNGVKISLTIDNKVAKKNDEQITLDVPPQIIGDRTLVPVRFIGEASGATVDWDSATRTVVITNGMTNEITALDQYFNTPKFFGKTQYSENATITNGELCTAGIRLLVNEVDLNYWGLKSEEPFVHPDARSLFLAGRDVLGKDKVTLEFINKKAIVSDAIAVLTYYGERNLTNPITIDRSILLPNTDKNKEITHKEIATLLMEIDAQGGLLNKFIITDKVIKAQSPMESDLSKYPTNKANFQSILKEIPTKIYETPYTVTTKTPKANYDFAREYNLVFTRMLTELVKTAKTKGVELSLTYYPVLSLDNGNGYTMRVKCDIINVSGNVNMKDIYKTNEDLKLTNGLSFFCDFNNNEPIGDMTMPVDKMTLNKIIK
jgi:hypothetical protein